VCLHDGTYPVRKLRRHGQTKLQRQLGFPGATIAAQDAGLAPRDSVLDNPLAWFGEDALPVPRIEWLERFNTLCPPRKEFMLAGLKYFGLRGSLRTRVIVFSDVDCLGRI
jgi:hypothetical protein